MNAFKAIAALSCVYLLSILWLAETAAAQEPARVSPAKQDADGILTHTVQSQYQSGETTVRILVPDRLEQGRRYPVLYVLPVEAGQATRWGDGLAEVQKHDLANRFGLICATPSFSKLPWYADHPIDDEIRQESYLLEVVLPLVDKRYPTLAEPDGRLLLGFSKSGWGAFCMLLRHPDSFGKAVAWDAPLMMDKPGRYGSGPIFGSEDNFAKYQITDLLRREAARFQQGGRQKYTNPKRKRGQHANHFVEHLYARLGAASEVRRCLPLAQENRLIHFGYGNFRDHHEAAHRLMQELGIQHVYHDGPKREHSWHSGWLPEAVEMLMTQAEPGSSRHTRDPNPKR